MVTLRCTQKLIKRLSQPISEVPPQPTTLLGDWYANILFARPQQLVLCISERTLLPVIVPAKDIHTFADRFVVAVHEVLTALGVAPRLADRECLQMRDIHFGKTKNRQILGSLNDLLFHFDYYLYAEPSHSLLQHSLFLGTIICKPIGYKRPVDVTLDLFGSGSNIGHTIQ